MKKARKINLRLFKDPDEPAEMIGNDATRSLSDLFGWDYKVGDKCEIEGREYTLVDVHTYVQTHPNKSNYVTATAQLGGYSTVASSRVSDRVRFDVPHRNLGQIVEVAYGGYGRVEHEYGAPYKRVIDRSLSATPVYYEWITR